MIKTVVREHHWAPSVVGALFFDKGEYDSLDFWYNDIVTVDKEMKEKTKK